MSDEIIYTNSQVEQSKYEIREQINVLQNKIKNIKFVTETIKVRAVRYITSIDWLKVKIAYHIEGHSSQFAENVYAYPVMYISGVNISGTENRFYVYAPVLPSGQKIVELTDDDILKVSYMVEKNLE